MSSHILNFWESVSPSEMARERSSLRSIQLPSLGPNKASSLQVSQGPIRAPSLCLGLSKAIHQHIPFFFFQELYRFKILSFKFKILKCEDIYIFFLESGHISQILESSCHLHHGTFIPLSSFLAPPIPYEVCSPQVFGHMSHIQAYIPTRQGLFQKDFIRVFGIATLNMNGLLFFQFCSCELTLYLHPVLGITDAAPQALLTYGIKMK